jgi:hypothetical protein
LLLFGALISLVAFWLPASRLFQRDHRVYFRKQNPLVAMVRDEISQRWMRRQFAGAS